MMATEPLLHRSHQQATDTNVAQSARARDRRPTLGFGRLHRPLLIALIVGALTNQFSISLGGLTLSFERAIELSMLPVLGYVLMFRAVSQQAQRLVWIWFGWCLILFLSAIASGRFIAHLAALLTSMLPIAILAFFVVRRLDTSDTVKIIRTALWIVSTIGAVEMLLKLADDHAVLAKFVFVPDGRLLLLTLEPNILASTMVVLVLATLPRARFNWTSAVLYTCSLITLLGAGSKMPVIALAAGLLVYGLLRSIALAKNGSGAVIVPIWIIGVLVTVLLPMSPAVVKTYNSTLARPDAISTRLYINSAAIRLFKEKPIIGRGPGDFAFSDRSTLAMIGSENPHDLWIAQMVLSILHDSGIFGLTIYAIFLIALLNRGFSFIRVGSLDHCGFFGAFLSLVISSQATTVHLNSIFGLAAGLLAATPVAVWGGYKRRTRRPMLL